MTEINRASAHLGQIVPITGRRAELRLGIEDFEWADLHDADGLSRLSLAFEAWLAERDATGLELLRRHRAAPGALVRSEVSALLVRLAPFVGAFLGRLFGLELELERAREALLTEEPVFQFKKHFVKKRVLGKDAGKAFQGAVGLARAIAEAAVARLSSEADDEERRVALATVQIAEALDVARKVARAGGASWTDALAARTAAVRAAVAPIEPALADADDEALLTRVCDAIEATLVDRRTREGDPARHWPSLRDVHKQDFDRLVPLRVPAKAVGAEHAGAGELRARVEPFALTDPRGGARQVAAEVDYCLYCHDREKDSCSNGLHTKQGDLAKNPLGVELAGCPLGEKISEAHVLRRDGEILGALAVVAVDNPLCPGTGHRICNDCMKACIFQKQEPVNIPLVETRVLDDVLALPFGFEVWSLLTRWNPLSARPHALPYNGKNVLVVGLGPAGYTLAHYLLNEGFGVVAVDGLKIEPLSDALLGGDGPPPPIRDVNELREPLEDRTVRGFGGVSEYGITVRWDKSFLTMLYLNLRRRSTFRAHGGVRFGGTLTLEDAWELGIDHVAIAAGAGKPTLVPMKNALLRGVRTASDFLMALQLSGAYKRNSLANLQVRLPAIVIGSGLTAIDTATELLAYYVVQSEKTLSRYEALSVEHGEARVRARFDAEEIGILDESLAHGRAIREERALALSEGREPRIPELLDGWGGVRIVYRRRLVDSPAYRLNHEEITKSLEEGVRYVELASPVEAHPDEHGAVCAVSFEKQEADATGSIRGTRELVRIPARSVFVAAGTKPNVIYEREYPGTFALDGKGFFANHAARVGADGSIELTPARGDGFFTSYLRDGRTVSYYGDNHPRYAGSVVKAMASAKDGHGKVVELFAAELARLDPEAQPARDAAWQAFAARIDDELTATVREVRRLAPSIVEVVVRAPRAARRFRPGQFYRLQSYERFAPRVAGTPLIMEGLALTGASTDLERGLLSLIVLEMGASSKLCAELRPGEPVVLMGPTGRPTEIAAGETVLLAGGGLGNAVLFSIARAFREAGSKVLYFAGYRERSMLFKQEEIEAATDQVVWATDDAPIPPRRPQDRAFVGNIVEAMLAYARGELGPRAIELSDVDRVLAIGSDGMMNAVARARHGVLQPYLKPGHAALGSINSPMQCMMKEVCAQCLQRQVDPLTGEERMVYSCFDQDQPLDRVDFAHLRQRLRQSTVQEKLTDMWFALLSRSLRAAE